VPVLHSLRHYLLYLAGLARAETQTSPAEQEAIARHARGRRQCVEIGVWHGVNTLRIRRAMAEDGVLWAVDPFPAGRLGFSIPERIARAEVARSSRGAVLWMRCASAEAARRRENPVDFIFIDGDHSYEALRTDWESWSPKLEPGGMVLLHDSRATPRRPIETAGSVRFTREVILADPRFETVETVETLTVLRRRGVP
jgi:predicted O-methyltransferase YrrM